MIKLLLLLLIVLIVACNSIEGETQRSDAGFKYDIVEIEGMTCIWVQSSAGYQGYAGLTCNWDEWKR